MKNLHLIFFTIFLGFFLLGCTSQTDYKQINLSELVKNNSEKIGSDSSPVLIIEFSDFQCLFCRKFYIQSWPSIKRDYIDSGKVQLIYKNFPLLEIHPDSQMAAEAAECANEQGKFELFHDELYNLQQVKGSGTVPISKQDLKDTASIASLDLTKFNICFESGKYALEVQKDFSQGVKLGIKGTPAFLIIKRGGTKAKFLSGALPYSEFKAAIDEISSE
ncbi:MAG: thioredoxin domain-containing protein [Candidatus Micrarchaeota archaeon]